MTAIAEGRSPAPPPRLTDIRPDVPATISAAVERALSQAPDGRFETAGAFVTALRAPDESADDIARAISAAEHAAARAEPVGRPARHGIGIVSVALLAFVIVGAAGAAWILGLGLTGGQPVASQPAPAQPSPVGLDQGVVPSPSPSVPRPDSTAGTAGVHDAPLPERPGLATAPAPATPRPKRAPPARVVPGPRRDAAPATSGRLFVNATPWGQVFVDDDLIGNTPRVGVAIPPGTHKVRVSRDGFEPFERTIQVGPGQEVRLTDIVLRESKP